MPGTQEKVFEIIANQMNIPASEVTNNLLLYHDLSMDSLDQVEMVMEIEDHFNVNIPDEEAEKLATVADVVNLVESKFHPIYPQQAD